MFEKKEITLHVQADKCTACGQCMMNCSRNAIGFGYKTDDSVFAKLVQPESCTGCGKCAKRCPQKAISVEIRKKEKPRYECIEMKPKIGFFKKLSLAFDLDKLILKLAFVD